MESYSFFICLIVSPPMAGTIPTSALPPMPNTFNPMLPNPGQPTILSPTTIIPPQAISRSPNAPYMQPAFHSLSHSDMLYKNPFSPFDLPNMRGVSINARPMYPIQHHLNMSIESQTSDQLSSSRLSPISSQRSSSSRPSSVHSDPNSSIKLNNSIESEESDDEQIDVVESTFVPILRPNLTAGLADSTVSDRDPYPILRARCELKAPSALKPTHEKASIGSQSPETKIKSPISTQKAVWRPY